MIELVGQRSQRPALGAADRDLPYQVTGQPVRHLADRHPQQAAAGLPAIIQNRQLLRRSRPKAPPTG